MVQETSIKVQTGLKHIVMGFMRSAF